MSGKMQRENPNATESFMLSLRPWEHPATATGVARELALRQRFACLEWKSSACCAAWGKPSSHQSAQQSNRVYSCSRPVVQTTTGAQDTAQCFAFSAPLARRQQSPRAHRLRTSPSPLRRGTNASQTWKAR